MIKDNLDLFIEYCMADVHLARYNPVEDWHVYSKVAQTC